ncbi:MAG: LacI family DNA-binding transcriptional regulator [Solirubrobacterales bacterium]|nr:LacI family DNA-binding transcriptional regulator [Solirubrobacterales bacterium]
MSDVARAAGVSAATVSRVLSGGAPVRPEVAEAVRATSDQLGYRANPIARALRRRSTQSVGIVVPDIANPFFPEIVQAVERALHDSGQSLLLCDSQNDTAIELGRVRALLDRRVDGLLIVPGDTRASAEAVREAAARVAVVQVDRHVDVATDFVGVDQDAGIDAVMELLLEHGRRTFAFVTGEMRISTARERATAYLRRVEPVDLASAARVHEGDFSVAFGREAAGRLLAGPELPEAIVCANDRIALGVLGRLRAAGVAVPGEVAVTGFDDNGFAAVSEPQLTTVRQPLDNLGREAVRMLLSAAAHPSSPPRRLRLTPELVERASTSYCAR